jgi:LysM repeat protein
MESLRQIGTGILLAVISIAVVLGGFTLATAEGHVANSVQATETLQLVVTSVDPNITTIPIETFTPLAAASAVVTETLLPTVTELASATPTTTPAPTASGVPSNTPQPTSALVCVPPSGWIAIVVQASDTLSSLAQTYQISQAAILQGNCLAGDQALRTGSLLYVQPRPVATQKIATPLPPCGAPYGWIDYYVVSGDTLYSIGLRYGVSVGELQRASCLGSSFNIQLGQRLKVPNVATTEPYKTATTVPPTTAPTVTEVPSPTNEPATDVPTAIPEAPSATPFSGVQ